MQRITCLLLLILVALPAARGADFKTHWRAVWHMSQALLAGAEAADASSSWGKDEANPMLRTGSRFSYGSLAIKLGTLGAGLAAQHFVMRRSPATVPLFATANLATAATLAVVADHNMHVPRQ